MSTIDGGEDAAGGLHILVLGDGCRCPAAACGWLDEQRKDPACRAHPRRGEARVFHLAQRCPGPSAAASADASVTHVWPDSHQPDWSQLALTVTGAQLRIGAAYGLPSGEAEEVAVLLDAAAVDELARLAATARDALAAHPAPPVRGRWRPEQVAALSAAGGRANGTAGGGVSIYVRPLLIGPTLQWVVDVYVCSPTPMAGGRAGGYGVHVLPDVWAQVVDALEQARQRLHAGRPGAAADPV